MKDRKKLIIMIIAIVIAISSIFIYKGSIEPKLYNRYLNEGIKYLMDEKYEEAILAFDKAIKIETKTTEARVYQAKAYIGNEEIDKAVEVLKEAQQIDITNEKLLKEILEILNEIDSDIAYEFLDRFIVAVGKDSISEEIKDILNSAYEVPSEAIADPEPGTYVNPISIKIKQDKIKVGHSYYYTLDGSEPNKNSEKYRGQIKISKNTTIKLIGYNINNDKTDVFTLEYIIDEDIIDEVKSNISKGESLINETIVGSEIGNIPQVYKNKLQLVIDKAKDLLNKKHLNYNDTKEIKNEIEDSINEFKDNIIKPTDKSKLKSAIDEAQNLYNNSKEGSNIGEYKVGSKAILLKSIDSSKKVNDDKLAKQESIDDEVKKLKNSISQFKSMKIQEDLEGKFLNKYVFIWRKEGPLDQKRIIKFTKNKIFDMILESSAGGIEEIISKTQEGNKIIYKTNYGYYEIEIIGNNSIRLEGKVHTLLTRDELMSTLHNIGGRGLNEILKGCAFGITENDIDKFYQNR